MRILFICTAHNSLSQRLSLALAQTHSVTVEYALSKDAMIEAAALVEPDLIICPFLTSHIPREIYNKYLTLIVHPGPPGDAGPSALDWVLMGDDGSEADASALLTRETLSQNGRTHWGVTVLQAVEEFDAGPVWAFEQFQIDIDAPDATKSNIYRGPVTRAALTATLAALHRISTAASVSQESQDTNTIRPATPITNTEGAECSPPHMTPCLQDPIEGSTNTVSEYDVTQQQPTNPSSTSGISPRLQPDPTFRTASVTHQIPFLGGTTHHRPLLKAAQRDFDIQTHPAREISRRIRCADSQPGCLSRVFGGVSLYVYGGTIEEGQDALQRRGAAQQGPHDAAAMETLTPAQPGRIVACRSGAVCVATCDGKGVWITHVRRIKRKCDAMLWPKVPAVTGLRSLGLLHDDTFQRTEVPRATLDWSQALHSTYQDVWVDFVEFTPAPMARRAAFVYFEFYNGAMSTDQCSELLQALEFVMAQHEQRPLSAVVLMGGDSYFSNGIALNVIEAAANPALESWRNINRIDDVVQAMLEDFPRRNITTVAAIRGNSAAGGVAMAAACDVVIAGSEVVLNPAYRALGLHGSEYHSLSYTGRCGPDGGRRLLRDMLPLSPYHARAMGLVDHTLPGHGYLLDNRIRNHVMAMVCTPGYTYAPAQWKSKVGLGASSSSTLANARMEELGEMAKDFWSPRSERYHSRRQDFVRKIKAVRTPLRFATHRRGAGGRFLDEEEADAFDDVATFERRIVVEKTRSGEVERQRETPLPLSPTDSGIQMDCSGGFESKEPVIVTGEVIPEKRDMGPVFACYYETQA